MKNSVKISIFLVLLAAFVFVSVGSVMAASSDEISYDGVWTGNLSYGDEICGMVEFNVSDNEVKTFVVNYTNISFDIIDVRGVKVASGSFNNRIEFSNFVTIQYSGVVPGEKPRTGDINEYPGSIATIVNNQFNYTSQHNINVLIFGVFTSNNNAYGTCKLEYHNISGILPEETYPSVLVVPLTTWNATKKIQAPEEKSVPGFGGVFAIAGLLVAILVVRKKDKMGGQ